MTIPTWIDGQADVMTGGVYFLVNHVDVFRGEADHYSLTEVAARTNGSGRACLNEWCGTTNDIAVYAHGLARVERFVANGRMRISPVDPTSPEGREALESLGYPDLGGEG